MKETDVSFLTNTKRINFVFRTLPILNLLIIITVVFTSLHPWLSLFVGLLTPLFGGLSVTLGRKSNREQFFTPLAIVLNGIVAFFFCIVAGPDSPAFIVGMAYVGACTVLLNEINRVLIFIAIGLVEIIAGSIIAGKGLMEMIVALVILLCYSVILVRFLQFTLKQGEEILEQKTLIEEKNKNITDSINYALRIQQAKLPEREKILAALPQSFVLFKPKDIVSGDFYFFEKKGDIVYIAAADCTGHGVPGALMSMIGMEKLDAAVLHHDTPSEILQQLNRSVRSSLKQTNSDESTRDGMDIALCKINTKARTINYAGANRPAWIIRNGTTVIEEIKATKKAIGGLTPDDEQFDTHTFQLQEGDTVYVFSDGYPDTFGGEKGKKLTTKKFKEVLVTIQQKSMQEQKTHLDAFIEKWKADIDQVDDILVIGIRV